MQAGVSPAFIASQLGHTDALQLLLQAKASPCTTDKVINTHGLIVPAWLRRVHVHRLSPIHSPALHINKPNMLNANVCVLVVVVVGMGRGGTGVYGKRVGMIESSSGMNDQPHACNSLPIIHRIGDTNII